MIGPSDEILVARCKNELPRVTSSYEMLVQRHMHHVYAIVYRLVNNKEEAEDITQDVFVKVFKHLKTFEQQASFSSWLYRIATNSALDALEKMKRRSVVTVSVKQETSSLYQEEDTLNMHPSSAPGPEERAIQTELRDCIQRVFQMLDREQASLLVMRDFSDLSYDEIANTLGAGLSAVKMRIHRARLAFQEIFSQFCGSVQQTLSTTPATSAKGRMRKDKV